mmetsp:Transcript_41490/g.108004  ORF Transcript_41490/g.108004 Transcript_41490/m.108004 type:complete len:81 (-) Transcript_41490:225-467(-)
MGDETVLNLSLLSRGHAAAKHALPMYTHDSNTTNNMQTPKAAGFGRAGEENEDSEMSCGAASIGCQRSHFQALQLLAEHI